jgi:hypothetical protein
MAAPAKAMTGRQMRHARFAANMADEYSRPLVLATVMKIALEHIEKHGAGADPVTFAALCGVVGGKNGLSVF